MRKCTAVVAASVVFTLILFAFRSDPYAAQKVQGNVQRWEYDTREFASTDLVGGGKYELNRMGKDGWELCGTAENGPNKATVLILKRPAK